MLAATAIAAIDAMEQRTDMFLELRSACRTLHAALVNLAHLELMGDQDTPIKHLRLRHSTGCRKHDNMILNKIANKVFFFWQT